MQVPDRVVLELPEVRSQRVRFDGFSITVVGDFSDGVGVIHDMLRDGVIGETIVADADVTIGGDDLINSCERIVSEVTANECAHPLFAANEVNATLDEWACFSGVVLGEFASLFIITKVAVGGSWVECARAVRGALVSDQRHTVECKEGFASQVVIVDSSAVGFITIESLVPADASGNVVAESFLFIAASFDARACFVAPDKIFSFAALGEASARASLGIEELIESTKTLVLARLALAAFGIPDGTARALVNGNNNASNGVSSVSDGNTLALAHALGLAPDMVIFASLNVAGTLALLSIPVVGVIDASLRNADPAACVEVPGVFNASGVVSVGSFEGAEAGFGFLVPVVVGVLADVADSELAVIHVPVGSFGCLSGSEATARAGLGVKEVAIIASLVVALAAAAHRVP